MTHRYFALPGSHSGMAVVMTALYILSQKQKQRREQILNQNASLSPVQSAS